MFCVERLMYSHMFRPDSGCNFSDADINCFLVSSDVKNIKLSIGAAEGGLTEADIELL